MKTFDKYAESLKPIPDHAQILMQLDGLETIEKVLETLKIVRLEPIKCIIVQKELPIRIIIHLASDDMREAVLKLSEAGFSNVKGINAMYIRPRKDGLCSGD